MDLFGFDIIGSTLSRNNVNVGFLRFIDKQAKRHIIRRHASENIIY